jgi:hypothetical protein
MAAMVIRVSYIHTSPNIKHAVASTFAAAAAAAAVTPLPPDQSFRVTLMLRL